MLTHLLKIFSLLLESFPRIVIIFTVGVLVLIFRVVINLQAIHNMLVSTGQQIP